MTARRQRVAAITRVPALTIVQRSGYEGGLTSMEMDEEDKAFFRAVQVTPAPQRTQQYEMGPWQTLSIGPDGRLQTGGGAAGPGGVPCPVQ